MKLTLKTNITNSHITTFQYRKQNIRKKIAPPVYPSPITSFLFSPQFDVFHQCLYIFTTWKHVSERCMCLSHVTLYFYCMGYTPKLVYFKINLKDHS